MVMEAAVLEKPGLNVAVGLRTYLEITGISAPPEAEEGDWVYVGVQVTNKYTADIYVTVIGTFDGIDTYPLGGAAAWVSPGEYMWWPLHFTMPNRSVTGTVYAYYWGTDEAWHLDDSATISIPLKGVPPVGWQRLDLATLTVSRAIPPVVGWQPLASRTIGVASAAPPVVGWQPLATTTIGVSAAAPPPVGWAPLDTATLAITAGPIAPEYELIEHVITPWAYFYEGSAEVASIVFTLPIGTTWLATDIANNFAEQLKERGSRLLEGKFYKDASALAVDRYRVDITAAAAEVGTIGWYIPWNLVFWASVAALVALIIYWAVNWVRSVTYHPKPLSEEVKAKWTRETLTGAITDLRPEMPPEELEAMADQDLRDLLNEIYKEEVPPAGWPWYVWLGITGVGIGGSWLAVTAIRTFRSKK